MQLNSKTNKQATHTHTKTNNLIFKMGKKTHVGIFLFLFKERIF